MTKRAKQQQRTGAPVVQCDRCDRWLYLDEAGFPDLAAASAASPFTCKPCLTVEGLQARLHALEAVVTGLVRQAAARGQEVPERSDQEQDTILSTLTPETGARRTPVSSPSGKPETQPLDGKSTPVDSDNPAQDDHSEPCGQEQDRVLSERPRIHTIVTEVGEKSQGAPLQELGTVPNSPGETEQVNVRQDDSLPAPDNMIDLSATVLEAPPMSNANATKQERRHSEEYTKSTQPSRDTQSQILLVGDGNVPRVAKALLRQLGPKQSVQTCWTQHATVKRAQKLLHQYIGESKGEPCRYRRLVVLLVGAADAIRGTRPEDIVQVIRDSVAPYAERLVICSAPEVTTRGKVTLAQTITLNAQLRKMCPTLKATFLDNSKRLEEGCLARDSALYVADTASQVATRLATLASNFLGNREGPRKRDKRGPEQKSGTVTTAHGHQGKLAPTARDIGGQGSEGQTARPHAQGPVPHWHPQPGTTQQPPQERMDPQQTENWARVSPPPVGLLFPETRLNDVRPQAL